MNKLYGLIAERTVQRYGYILTAQRPLSVGYHEFTHVNGETPRPCEDLAWPGTVDHLSPENKRELPPHDHDHCELLLIIGGKAVHRTQHYVAPLGRGDIVMTSPGQPHAFDQIDGIQRIECGCLSECVAHGSEDLWGEPGVLQLFLAPDALAPAGSLRVTHHRLNEENLALCIAEFRAMALELERGRPSLPYLRRCLGKLIIVVGRSYADSQGLDPSESLNEQLLDWLRIIENHASSNEPFRVSDLAKQYGLSPGHLARQFNKAVGVSPSQYFQHRRVQHACWLLLHTQHSVTDIAYALGFSDVPHFERVFHERRKMTPRAYRDRFSEKKP